MQVRIEVRIKAKVKICARMYVKIRARPKSKDSRVSAVAATVMAANAANAASAATGRRKIAVKMLPLLKIHHQMRLQTF